LLNHVLKKDFGFKGRVLSDWDATHSTVKAANAGLDQEMPGDDFFGAPLKRAVAFGHGLSYTTFQYSNLKTDSVARTLQFQLRNAGSIAGAEVAQVYITLPPNSGEPFQRLAGWQRVQLAPGESKTVTVPLDPAYLSIFDVASDKWKLLAGDYKIAVGTVSDAAHLAGSVHVQSPEGDSIPVPAAGEMASRRAEW
jgi:hypothetical protein